MAAQPTNGNVNHQDHPAASSTAQDGAESGGNLSKDEVGWYFVEQYYLTLSKSPERLHLFYGKQSQFVYGLEAEVANVSVGRQSIQERIKSLDLQDCKVRVTNVDTQATGDGIVIQVIGETVNKAAEPKKFVQTFILAKQPSGYFVLNDILRYIHDDAEEEETETNAPAEAAASSETPAASEAVESGPGAATEEPAEETPAAQLDAAVVDQKLEDASVEARETPSTSAINTPAEAAASSEETTAAAVPKTDSAAESAPDPETTAQQIAAEELKKAETPKDPAPTPAAPRAAAPVAAAEPEKPKEPAKPMTWASRIAAAAGPARPAVALPKPVTPAAAPAASTAASRPAAPAAATPAATQPAATTAPVAAPDAAPAGKEAGNEWQTAGADSKRQGRPQPPSNQAPEKDGTLGYVKFVTEKVKTENLRTALSAFGELVYFDINRPKNCAFVEFATPAAYQAAAAANPHVIDGENIIVEARRPKANAYGGSSYNNRGSISGRGRGGYDGNRSGSQSGRGAFTGQTRGGGRGGAPRGRGVSQPANA